MPASALTYPLQRLTVQPDGTPMTGDALFTISSGTGLYSLFTETGAEVLGTPGNGRQLYLRNNVTGEIELISRSLDGLGANKAVYPATISADGRFVSYATAASNIVPGDTDGYLDSFLFDRQTGQTIDLGDQAGSGSWQAVMQSANGRFIALVCHGGGTALSGIYRYDTQLKTTTRLYAWGQGSFDSVFSVTDKGTVVFRFADAGPSRVLFTFAVGPEAPWDYAVSAPWVVFSADGTRAASNVDGVPHSGPALARFHLRAAGSGGTVHELEQADSAPGGTYTPTAQMDASGRFVVYLSNYDYPAAKLRDSLELYLWDTNANTVVKLVGAMPDALSNTVVDPQITLDGHWISFTSTSAYLVDGDTNRVGDIFRVENPFWHDAGTYHERPFQAGPFEGAGGADTLYGTSGNNAEHGGGGDDLLYGFTGNDELHGEQGADTLVGGPGADTLFGGTEADLLWGDGQDPDGEQGGTDELYGEDGNDTLHGGAGKDTLDGGAGDDKLYGDIGNDDLYGQAGKDTLYGGQGDDDLDGGDNDDELHGGPGSDTLYGGKGNDTIWGNDVDGADELDVVHYDGRASDYQFDEIIHAQDGAPSTVVRNATYGYDTVYNVSHATFDHLRTNTVSTTNIYMQLADAANHAYNNVADLGYGWAPLSALELGVPPTGTGAGFTWTYHQGQYVAVAPATGGTLEADAQVYFGVVDGKNTLLLAIRGTDQLLLDGQDYPTMLTHYAKFKPLVDAVLGYVNNGGYAADGHIDQVWVSGHSLGGAVVQLFMQDERVYGNPMYTAATFGSPGAPLVQPDSRILHFEHQNDPVPLVSDFARFLTSFDYNDLKADDPLVKLYQNVFGNNVTGFHPTGGVVRMRYDQQNPLNPIEPHSMDNYVLTMQRLVAFRPELDWLTAGSYALLPGTHTELVIGGSGDDTIAGDNVFTIQAYRGGAYTDGSEVLLPGIGHDTITGNSGLDTVMGTLSELDGDTITDIVGGERIRVWGESFGQNELIWYPNPTSVGGSLNVHGAKINIAADRIGVFFTVEAGNGYTDILYTGGASVTGGTGDDNIGGGTGDDTVAGGAGNDTVAGGAGRDHVFGDAVPGTGFAAAAAGGNDVLMGGLGADTLTGGAGLDTFIGTAAELDGDEITDLANGEEIVVRDMVVQREDITLEALHGATALHLDTNHDGIADTTITVDRPMWDFLDPRLELSAQASLGGTAIALDRKQVSFEAPKLSGYDNIASAGAVGDVDGDRKADLVLVQRYTGRLDLVHGNNDGTFGATATVNTGLDQVSDIRLQDLDGNGTLDLVATGFRTARPDEIPPAYDANGKPLPPDLGHAPKVSTVLVYKNVVAAGLVDPLRFDMPHQASWYTDDFGGHVFLADANGDGRLDIVASHVGEGFVDSVSVLLQGADGGFTLGETAQFDFFAGQLSQVVDLNGDGRADLLISSSDGEFGRDVSALFQDAQGHFGPKQTLLVTEPHVSATAVDLNHDGTPELVLNGGQQVATRRPDGTYAVAPGNKAASGNTVLFGDLNGDGQADFVGISKAADSLAGSVSVLPGLSDGTLGRVKTVALGPDLRWAGLADVNGDGKADLVGVDGGYAGSGIKVALNDQYGDDAGFAFTNATTGASGHDRGVDYTGPVAGLERQMIWGTGDSAAIVAGVPNVFLKGNAGDDALMVRYGNNVIDGGGGSNFLIGGTGTDGGADTFFVDATGGDTTWSTLVNFHQGDRATIFGFHPGLSTRDFVPLDGAAGFQGLTLRSEIGGAGTGVKASMTFAGIDQATAAAHFEFTTGSLPGNIDYLLVEYR